MSNTERSFSARRTEQMAAQYLAEYGTVEAAQTAIIHGSGLEYEAAERVCAELELLGDTE